MTKGFRLKLRADRRILFISQLTRAVLKARSNVLCRSRIDKLEATND